MDRGSIACPWKMLIRLKISRVFITLKIHPGHQLGGWKQMSQFLYAHFEKLPRRSKPEGHKLLPKTARWRSTEAMSFLTRVAIPHRTFTSRSLHPSGLVEGNKRLQRLRVPEGCERPSDKPELNSLDERYLSVAIQNMTLARRKFVRWIAFQASMTSRTGPALLLAGCSLKSLFWFPLRKNAPPTWACRRSASIAPELWRSTSEAGWAARVAGGPRALSMWACPFILRKGRTPCACRCPRAASGRAISRS